MNIEYPGLSIFRHNLETIQFDGKFTKNEITKFIQIKLYPSIIEFSNKIAKQMYDENNIIHNNIMLFVSDDEYDDDVKGIFAKLANEFIGKLNFIHVQEDKKNIYEFVGVKESETPIIIAFNAVEGNKKYKFENEFNIDNIRKFCNDVIDKKAKLFLISEDIPKKQTGPVYVLFILLLESCW